MCVRECVGEDMPKLTRRDTCGAVQGRARTLIVVTCATFQADRSSSKRVAPLNMFYDGAMCGGAPWVLHACVCALGRACRDWHSGT